MEILVPVDDSACSARAVAFAAEFGERYDAAVRIVHLSDAETDAARQVLDNAREALDEADADPPEATTEVVLREMATPTASRVGHEILAYAKEEDIDHIVMGHHGAGRVERAILGSAAETVVRGETVPVTVVP